jgi:hypothetical protein
MIAEKPPPPSLKPTLPPLQWESFGPAGDSISDKEIQFNIGSLNYIKFLSHPVSTAGGGIKGGGPF